MLVLNSMVLQQVFHNDDRVDHVVDSFLELFVLVLEWFVVFVVVQVALADLDYQRAVLTKLPPRKVELVVVFLAMVLLLRLFKVLKKGSYEQTHI